MYSLHLIIISPIQYLAQLSVIYASCLPLPFISLALSDYYFFSKHISLTQLLLPQEYHQATVIFL